MLLLLMWIRANIALSFITFPFITIFDTSNFPVHTYTLTVTSNFPVFL